MLGESSDFWGEHIWAESDLIGLCQQEMFNIGMWYKK